MSSDRRSRDHDTDRRGGATIDDRPHPIDDWADDPWDEAAWVAQVEPVRHQTTVAKWVAFTALGLVAVLIVAGGFVGMWYIRQANPSGDLGPPVQFTIAAGESLDDVSNRLETDGIIENAGFFRWYVGRHGGLDITEGLYLIPTGDHVGNVLGRLRTPPSETFTSVTFPEGFTLQQMADRLAEAIPQFDSAAFIAAANDPAVVSEYRPAGVTSMEGLLFPATYRVSNADTEIAMVERMTAQSERVGLQEDLETGAANLGYTPYQVLIVASMIEKEAKTEEDRLLIARVIYNRLARGMPLQIDATVLYNVDLTTLVEGDITRLRSVDTLWNTFTRNSFPATPIANPGRASIEAALNPAPNPSTGSSLCNDQPADTPCEYTYYVLYYQDRGHKFSVTAEQFQTDLDYVTANGLQTR